MEEQDIILVKNDKTKISIHMKHNQNKDLENFPKRFIFKYIKENKNNKVGNPFFHHVDRVITRNTVKIVKNLGKKNLNTTSPKISPNYSQGNLSVSF